MPCVESDQDIRHLLLQACHDSAGGLDYVAVLPLVFLIHATVAVVAGIRVNLSDVVHRHQQRVGPLVLADHKAEGKVSPQVVIDEQSAQGHTVRGHRAITDRLDPQVEPFSLGTGVPASVLPSQ